MPRGAVTQDDLDIIHFDNSSDLPLSTSLNDLDNATLHIDGQLKEVDALPYIIDVVDQDDDITNDEDALPHDLVDSNNEDLINVDDDGVDKMSADVARSHGGDGGGEDRPPPHHVPSGKGKRKPNLGGRAAGRLNTRDKTRNLSLKEVTDKKALSQIRLSCMTTNVCLSCDQCPLLATSGRSLGRQSSGTQEYPSLIDTFFVAHTVNGEFLRDEDRRIYENEEVMRLRAPTPMMISIAMLEG
ncbi:hypothetical protein Tco_0018868 [Tanacetum coccineum]